MSRSARMSFWQQVAGQKLLEAADSLPGTARESFCVDISCYEENIEANFIFIACIPKIFITGVQISYVRNIKKSHAVKHLKCCTVDFLQFSAEEIELCLGSAAPVLSHRAWSRFLLYFVFTIFLCTCAMAIVFLDKHRLQY